MSSPLTRTEKTPWAELSEAQLQGERSACPGDGRRESGLRLRRDGGPGAVSGEDRARGREHSLVR